MFPFTEPPEGDYHLPIGFYLSKKEAKRKPNSVIAEPATLRDPDGATATPQYRMEWPVNTPVAQALEPDVEIPVRSRNGHSLVGCYQVPRLVSQRDLPMQGLSSPNTKTPPHEDAIKLLFEDRRIQVDSINPPTVYLSPVHQWKFTMDVCFEACSWPSTTINIHNSTSTTAPLHSYPVVGIEGGSSCVCAGLLPPDALKTSLHHCASPCFGDFDKPCGGQNFVLVYAEELRLPAIGKAPYIPTITRPGQGLPQAASIDGPATHKHRKPSVAPWLPSIEHFLLPQFARFTSSLPSQASAGEDCLKSNSFRAKASLPSSHSSLPDQGPFRSLRGEHVPSPQPPQGKSLWIGLLVLLYVSIPTIVAVVSALQRYRRRRYFFTKKAKSVISHKEEHDGSTETRRD